MPTAGRLIETVLDTGVCAVSYTHLDVYKRQTVQYIIVLFIEFG